MSFLVALFSIIAVIVNCAKPEATKSLVNFFGGEKGFALATTLIASIFLAISVAGIACIAVSHSKDKEIKNLKNSLVNKIIARRNNMKKIELTLNKSDLSVTGNLDELLFDEDNENMVVTESGEILTLKEEKNNKVSYKITGYKEKYDDENSIEDVEIIKDKLFSGNSETSKNITVFSKTKTQELAHSIIQAAFYDVIKF